MNIIDQGLINRIEEVREMVESENPEVSKAIEDVEQFTRILLNNTDESVSQTAHDMDAAIGWLINVTFEAAYRVGMSEGMQLQQEINALRAGGRK